MSPRARPALALLFLAISILPARAQRGPDVAVYVDDAGVLRWSATGEEVALFGVNYTTPFAYAYRAHGYLEVDRRKAIDRDVAHLARLGLDAFRVHVWDREVSDRQGNLLENEHLDLLDYLLARLHERGIKTILTPIAWWPTGYPEPAPRTSGFSERYDKGGLTTDPEARRVQEHYVREFIRHVNPYTGRSYRDDPDILAIEIFNEPNHPGPPAETTRFIDALARALREEGLRKPIFYNVSEGYSDAHGRAVCAAAVDGISAQWYPTGLVRGAAIEANMLPNVDRYPLPFSAFEACRDKARMVYEYDAADVAGSHLYPAMARSFRGAGFKWATQFAYDPLAIAYSNTEYPTHFLNLVYTPGKAISFLIAGEVFRRLPRGADYGRYPENERFGPFRVSYEEDLSEMVEDTVFFHSNTTSTAPPRPAALRHVAGVGSSPVVGYEGAGAFFLDRLAEGVWRLEVYPDAVAVVDPYTRPSLAREAVRILWRSWPMTVALPDLGEAFSVEPFDAGNDHRPAVEDGRFTVRPGVYLLTRAGVSAARWRGGEERDRLAAFYAPPPSEERTVVLHTPPEEIPSGEPLRLRADLVAAERPDSAVLFVRTRGSGRLRRLPMHPLRGRLVEAELSADWLRPGPLEYAITVYERGHARTFPSGADGAPVDWDYTGQALYEVDVVEDDAPLLLYDARRDRERLLYPTFWNYVRFATELVAGTQPERLALRAVVTDFEPAPRHFALRATLPASRRGRRGDFGTGAVLQVRARSAGRARDTMQVALVDARGAAWGAAVALTDAWQEIELPLHTLRRVPLILLPRGYPGFLAYRFEAAAGAPTTPSPVALDGVQFTLDPDGSASGADLPPRGFELERVTLRNEER